MFKVIIVDDEIFFRDYIRTLINWEDYEFEVCAEARNGNEAMELCEFQKPDIALIDINMPVIDGLTLSEKLKEKYEDIKIVLITGYNDFEYARRAIRIGVEDYIVKPFDQNELLAALLRIKGRFLKIKDDQSNKVFNQNVKKEMVLNLLLEGPNIVDHEIVKMHKERLDIDLCSHSFIVATVEIDHIYQKWSSLKNIIDSKYSVISVMKDLIKVECRHFVFNGPESRIVSIVGFKTEKEIEEFNTDIYYKVSNFIRKYFDFSVTIGVGTVVTGFKSIRKSYHESLDALRYNVLSGEGSVVLYSKIMLDTSNCGFYPNDVNMELVIHLRLNDMKGIKKVLNKVFQYIDNGKLSIDSRYAIIMGLKSVCLSYIVEMGKCIEEVLGIGFSPMNIISREQSMESCYKELIRVFERTIQYFFNNNNNSKTKNTAEIIKLYIDEQYKDTNLNLDKIAMHLYISNDYLRKVFKKELNITLTDYITSVRMQKAKELIDNENIKFTNLCMEVGYSDVSYFSKCFKKYYGLSPRDYENSKNKLIKQYKAN